MPKVNVKVPQRNGFDKSFKHLLTGKVGTLVPILCDELPANSRVHLKSALMAQLPPLATDTFMRVNLKLEAFFVPTRLLYGGYCSWLTGEEIRVPSSPNNPLKARLPILKYSYPTGSGAVAPGSLSDYLGLKTTSASSSSDAYFNIFPFLAYHKIWSDWYRNPNVQADCFSRPLSGDSTLRVYQIPYFTIDSSVTQTPAYTLNAQLADGVLLGNTRQRNFGYDYFTNAMPNAQRGNAQKVTIDTSDNTFTIAALRAANSLQQYAERNMLASPRWQDYLKANYGANLSDGVAQRTIYLGSGELNVYNKSIYMTSGERLADDGATNPFATYGGASSTQTIGSAAKYGDASASGQLNLIDDFTTQEPGYIMVMASLVPVVTYSHGIDRMFFRNNDDNAQPDLATPILQNVGNQPIYVGELTGLDDKSVFGYTDRYADFKHKNDMLSGLVRDGESLGAFAAQRSVTGTPQISSDFLKIPVAYMDNVTAVKEWLSQFGYWLDAYFDYKVSMPLDTFSIPSLQDPAYEHGIDVQIDTNGSRIA